MNRLFSKIARGMEMIKVAHTVFALPFALTALLLAQRRQSDGAALWPPLKTVLLVVFACYCARTAAMTFNRIADRRLDALNPRTKNRELVTGALSLRFAWTFLIVHCVLFIAAAWGLNGFACALSPLCLLVLLGYSYTKRFTALSHFALGAALGLAPVGAWIALEGADTLHAAEPFLLGLGVLLWTAGFDVIYACQDYESDLETGLHSIPRRFGLRRALWLSSAIHLAAWLGFLAFWGAAGLGSCSLLGLLAMGALLIYEHAIVTAADRTRINVAFFTINGAISVAFFFCVLLDLWLR